MARPGCDRAMCSATDPVGKALWRLLDDMRLLKSVDPLDSAEDVQHTAQEVRALCREEREVDTMLTPKEMAGFSGVGIYSVYFSSCLCPIHGQSWSVDGRCPMRDMNGSCSR